VIGDRPRNNSPLLRSTTGYHTSSAKSQSLASGRHRVAEKRDQVGSGPISAGAVPNLSLSRRCELRSAACSRKRRPRSVRARVFLTRHMDFPIPSPVILERIGLRFRKAVAEFAAEGDVPVIRFAKGERMLEVMRPHLDRLVREGRTGVAAIGVAQEFQRVFTGTTYHCDEGGGGVPRFGYAKADHRVSAYYFYLVDEAFGPALIKVCAYPIRSRFGSTVMSTRNGLPRWPGSVTPSWTPGAPPPMTMPDRSASATCWGRARSGYSANAGGRGYRCR